MLVFNYYNICRRFISTGFRMFDHRIVIFYRFTMNSFKFVVVLFAALVVTNLCNAQESKTFIKEKINVLASPSFHGRGYVMGGSDKASQYIANEFKQYGVQPVRQNGSYFQDYQFSVNTFPSKVVVKVNNDVLKPGPDFIVNAASAPWHDKKPNKFTTIDLSNIKDSTSWDSVKSSLVAGEVYYLLNADTPGKKLKLGIRKFAKELPRGLFIVPKHGKLTWTVSQDQAAATIVYIEDTVLPKKPKKVLVDISSIYIEDFKAKNVIGYVEGTEVPDSFIVFTAHYDHLGRMGRAALFAGASDNASGTALVMYMANYFAKNPSRYSIAFMLFSGEEAGLVGSKHYAEHPLFPLENIRFLVNLDMTGDATNGITVVNSNAHENEFNLLQEINKDSTYATKIKKRGQTSNSDHYHFSKAGVPAFFIYSMGTIGHYHDVFDLPKDINLRRVDDLAELLIKFESQLSNTAQ